MLFCVPSQSLVQNLVKSFNVGCAFLFFCMDRCFFPKKPEAKTIFYYLKNSNVIINKYIGIDIDLALVFV